MVTNQRTRVKLLSDTFSEILVKGDSGEITLKPNGKLFKNQIINQCEMLNTFTNIQRSINFTSHRSLSEILCQYKPVKAGGEKHKRINCGIQEIRG